MAAYQHASDAHSGQAYSGVVRADGRWCPCAAGNTDWADYQTWAATAPNVADPYKSPVDGGVAIVLQTDEVAVGSMIDSLPGATSDLPPMALAPPENVDIPSLQGTGAVGDTLTITMGNWNYEPTNYTAQWLRGGAIQVGTETTYVVQASDVGQNISCVVTAENSMGFTTAPPSNVVTAVAAGGVVLASRAAAPARQPNHEPEHERHTGRARRE
jgi:hypothetical protein